MPGPAGTVHRRCPDKEPLAEALFESASRRWPRRPGRTRGPARCRSRRARAPSSPPTAAGAGWSRWSPPWYGAPSGTVSKRHVSRPASERP